jgi:hypothetical protein
MHSCLTLMILIKEDVVYYLCGMRFDLGCLVLIHISAFLLVLLLFSLRDYSSRDSLEPRMMSE